MKNIIIIMLSLITLQLSAASKHERMERALNDLDKAIANRDAYIASRQESIDSLKSLLPAIKNSDRRIDLIQLIGDAYNTLDNDSALHYYTLGYDEALIAGKESKATSLKLKRAMILPLSGFIKDAVDEFERVDPELLPDSLKLTYYETGRQMYSYIASFFNDYPTTKLHWGSRSDRFRDSILANESPETNNYKLLYGEKLFDEGNIAKSKEIFLEMLKKISPRGNLYARVTHKLANIAIAQDDNDDAAYYLALSAIADIRGAVLEVMALQELGVRLADSGDISRAYNYLSVALSNAVECNALMRILQSSTALPLIENMHSQQINSWRNTIYVVIALMALTLVAVAILAIYLRQKMKEMSLLQKKLRNANEVKEIYISQFFRLCSIYIDKLNQFCKIANRKITSGQIDDLYKITKSGKLVEEQSEEFYKLFDDAFLHIYPTFVKDVNSLLREKIVLKDGELLNNDLRILAFMRLGLEDTNQVALILNYSVNTIYAYRNKLRNRAYDRDNFERDIMNIGALGN